MTEPLGPRATVGTPAEAAAVGTVILSAVPYESLKATGRDQPVQLAGKVVLDACNPAPSHPTADGEGVGALSARALPGVRQVRAFSAINATAVDAWFGRKGATLGVPPADDDAAAVQIAAHLVRDDGCEPVVVGDLASAPGFQRGNLAFRPNTTAPELRRRLGLPANA